LIEQFIKTGAELVFVISVRALYYWCQSILGYMQVWVKTVGLMFESGAAGRVL